MFVYWSMFAAPAVTALLAGPAERSQRRLRDFRTALLFLAFVALIGLRYRVGGDWYNYVDIVDYIKYENLALTLKYSDPGFGFVSWISTRIGLDLAGASIVCAAALMFGLIKYAIRLPDPWLAITAAVPYLVIVVGMGYMRQSAAIGFIFLALIALERGALVKFLAWMSVAALFHVGSLSILPLAGIAVLRRHPALVIPMVAISVVLYVVLLQARIDTFYTNYVEAEYDSSGAAIRLLMNAVPALLFAALWPRFQVDKTAKILWGLFSAISILMILIVFYFPSTTALDRIGIYFIPLQIFVFGHLRAVSGEIGFEGKPVSYLVVAYYAAVLFIWLNFADNARYWLPYQFWPI